MSGIRIVLTVTQASPELYAALQAVPARLRAERVRTLATLGLVIASGGAVGIKPASPSAATDSGHAPGAPVKALNVAKTLGVNI